MNERALDAATIAVAEHTGQRLPPAGSVVTCEGIAQAAITAYLAAMETEGFVMVPVEPTETMLEAGLDGIYDQSGDTKASEIWQSMLAACPK